VGLRQSGVVRLDPPGVVGAWAVPERKAAAELSHATQRAICDTAGRVEEASVPSLVVLIEVVLYRVATQDRVGHELAALRPRTGEAVVEELDPVGGVSRFLQRGQSLHAAANVRQTGLISLCAAC
jgi:hypothetical protein